MMYSLAETRLAILVTCYAKWIRVESQWSNVLRTGSS